MENLTKLFYGNFYLSETFPNLKCFRNKKPAQYRKPFQDRLSVPNLSEELSPEETTFEMTKFGRAPDTGELQTINEGLITPVIRRKQFAAAVTGAASDNYTNAEYFEKRNGKISMDANEVDDDDAEEEREKPKRLV